jgi:hypothetical protein
MVCSAAVRTAPRAAPTTGTASGSAFTSWTGTVWQRAVEAVARPALMSSLDSVRCSGTKTPSRTMVSLPVPRMPSVNQVSFTVTSARGTAKNRTSPRPSGPTLPGTAEQAKTQSANRIPLMYFHSPVSRQPPGTRSALPAGMSAPAIRASGPSAQSTACPSGGRYAPYRAA